MKITYIHHSSFLLESSSCSILFDFSEGIIKKPDCNLPFYVMISHSHYDHYTKDVYKKAFDAYQNKEGLYFLLSDDIPKKDVPGEYIKNTVFLKPHMYYDDETIDLYTLLSNDLGIAFTINIEDNGKKKSIYFAGDLNAWNWDGDEEDIKLISIYKKELSSIKEKNFDIAFIPLDPRLKENSIQGITDFFSYCNSTHIVPMHCFGDYDIISKARKNTKVGSFMERILPIKAEGDIFEI